MDDLFRTEAVDHQRQRLLGRIILRQTWSAQALTLLFGVLVCALVAVFFLLGFARRETLTGVLLPAGGLVHANSPQSGQVQQVRVAEGAIVQAGDLLFVLSGEREGERGQTHERIGLALSDQRELLGRQIDGVRRQAELDRDALARKRERIDAQLGQLSAGIELQRHRVALAADAAQRFGSAEYSIVVSREKLDEKRSDAIEQEMRMRAMQRDHAALQAERDALRAEIDGLPLRLLRDIAALQGSLGGIRRAEAENDTQGRWEVRAPRGGRVTVVVVDVGQSVAAGTVLASIAPEEALEAVLYAPSRAAGQIVAGTPVQVRFDALPYQKYGQFPGDVREVSRSPVPASEVASVATSGQPMYRVRVRLRGDRLNAELRAALKAGMQIDATLTLEHRRFYEWVLEPLLGTKARLS